MLDLVHFVLCIVIGKSGEKIPKALALDYVYGYTIINDITDRKAQSEQVKLFDKNA
jgi:2-keto-4-pentenoate hydratase/2-oxohepta-3-ene-1,7-dioic acid hydratase in catechol pathway